MTDTDTAEAARVLFARPAAFVRAASALADLPPDDAVPEVALAGRSNVGKSSLLNALAGRTALARTAAAPGRTRALNVYTIAGGAAHLVDMPGYGYAQVSKTERAGWARLLDAYLAQRRALRAALVLIDARHGPKDSDRAMLARLGTAGVAARAVLTKADKVSARALAEAVEATRAALKPHACAFPEPLTTSAAKGAGIPELRVAVAGVLGLL
jgi:GTP-binding protein